MSCELVTHTNRNDWLNGRNKSIGSSDSACILGYGYASQSKYALWAEKCRGYTQEHANSIIKQFEKGQAAEPYIARLCEIERGWKVQFDPPHSYRRSLELNYLTASLDAWAVIDGENAVLEFKNISSWAAREWNPAQGKAPLQYVMQVQHQLLVTGWSKGYLGAINGYNLKLVEVPRNESFIAVLRREYADFWHHVSNNIEPDPDHSEPTRKAIGSVHPARKGLSAKTLDDAQSAIVSEMVALEEEVDKKTKRLEMLRNQLTVATDGANNLVTTDGQWYSFKGIRGGKRRLKAQRKPK